MVLIESIFPADAAGNVWRVKCTELDGSVTEFKSPLAELAVEFALLAVTLTRCQTGKWESIATQCSDIANRLPKRLLGAGTVSHRARRLQKRVSSRRINRVGSRMPQIAMTEARTCGQRMTKRRMELRLTQADVAANVTIRSKSGARTGIDRPLSRNAYSMYEKDAAEPGLGTINRIAAALSVSPAWLAFGVGHPPKTEVRALKEVICG